MNNSYEAKLVRVIDGDTAIFDLKKTSRELGYQVTKITHDVTVRFLGINTPERGRDGYYDAKGHVWSRLEEGEVLIIETNDNTDVFDRLLGTILVDGVNLNEELLELGLAEVYK